MSRLGRAAFLQGKYAGAESLYKLVLETQRRVLGSERPDTLYSMNGLANVYDEQGKYPQAEALYSQCLDIKRRVLGSEHPDTLASMGNLANAYINQGRYPQAEALYSQTLEIRRRVLGSEHPDTLEGMNDLATLYSQALRIQQRTIGPEHPNTPISMNNLGSVYYEQGKYAQAEALFSRALEIGRRVSRESAHFRNPRRLCSHVSTARQICLSGDYAAQALAGRRHTLGPEHPDTMDVQVDLALARQSQGKFDESEPLARKAFELERRNRPDGWQ